MLHRVVRKIKGDKKLPVNVFVSDNMQYSLVTIIYLCLPGFSFEASHCLSRPGAQSFTSHWTFVACSLLTAYFPLHAAPSVLPDLPLHPEHLFTTPSAPVPLPGPSQEPPPLSPLGGVSALPSLASLLYAALGDFPVLSSTSPGLCVCHGPSTVLWAVLSCTNSACRLLGTYHLFIPGRDSDSEFRKKCARRVTATSSRGWAQPRILISCF